MSENLDLVRSIFADWERGEFGRDDWVDPDIEFVIADGPDARTLKGVRAMAVVWREFLNAWTGYGVQADNIRELGDGTVLAVVHTLGRGKTSGVELARTGMKGANVFDVDGGKVTRLAIYFDQARALEDLGLEE
jgi:ketosteroid isomerase-like protein